MDNAVSTSKLVTTCALPHPVILTHSAGKTTPAILRKTILADVNLLVTPPSASPPTVRGTVCPDLMSATHQPVTPITSMDFTVFIGIRLLRRCHRVRSIPATNVADPRLGARCRVVPNVVDLVILEGVHATVVATEGTRPRAAR